MLLLCSGTRATMRRAPLPFQPRTTAETTRRSRCCSRSLSKARSSRFHAATAALTTTGSAQRSEQGLRLFVERPAGPSCGGAPQQHRQLPVDDQAGDWLHRRRLIGCRGQEPHVASDQGTRTHRARSQKVGGASGTHQLRGAGCSLEPSTASSGKDRHEHDRVQERVGRVGGAAGSRQPGAPVTRLSIDRGQAKPDRWPYTLPAVRQILEEGLRWRRV